MKQVFLVAYDKYFEKTSWILKKNFSNNRFDVNLSIFESK